MADNPVVTIPDQAIGGPDIAAPLQSLLNALNMLDEDDKSGGTWLGTPSQAAAIIESGATSLAKWWAAVLAALGGGTAAATVATRFWNGEQGTARVALLASVGAVVVAAVIALALIVSSDIRSRAAGMSAVYAARATVAQKFLAIAFDASQAPEIDSKDLEALVTSASGQAVAAQVESLGASLTSIEAQVSDMERTTAVVTAAAVKQMLPEGPKVVVRNANGDAGYLQGLEVGPPGADAVHLRVKPKEGNGPADHLKLDDVTELRSRAKR